MGLLKLTSSLLGASSSTFEAPVSSPFSTDPILPRGSVPPAPFGPSTASRLSVWGAKRSADVLFSTKKGVWKHVSKKVCGHLKKSYRKRPSLIIYLLEMVISHGYVELLEGISSQSVHISTTSLTPTSRLPQLYAIPLLIVPVFVTSQSDLKPSQSRKKWLRRSNINYCWAQSL